MTREAQISALQTPAGNIRSTGFSSDYDNRLARLAFLAPDLQRSIVDGTFPASLRLEHLLNGEMPISWAAQRTMAWAAAQPG